jgi:hypothetical protein
LKDKPINEGLQKPKGHYSNLSFPTGSVQTDKQATGKMKNGNEGVEWLIFEAPFKLGRKSVIDILL